MLAMYFERLNSGLPLYETIGRTGMLALCIFRRPLNLGALDSVGFSLKYRLVDSSIISEYCQFTSWFSFYSLCWVFLELNIRSTVKVVIAFLDVVFIVENDCCLTFIC